MGDVLYVDSSALVKMVVAEAESEWTATAVGEWRVVASSILARVEVTMAARRRGPDVTAQADRVRAALDVVALDEAIVELATRRVPPGLRAVDAVHVASAMSLGDELGAMLTFDRRQSAAAADLDLPLLPLAGRC